MKSMTRIIPRDQHNISRKNISNSAIRVMKLLGNEGFDAYLVGGSVRDLALGLSPKDFDVATNAMPEQIKAIFRSSRIIGRRFKIVHVRFGREIIEVATFRADHKTSAETGEAASSQHGMLTLDNVYGDIVSDAYRRDFTVNALYYTLNEFALHDYVNGLEDLEKRVVRMIGDPEQRYIEDPVRMLRALRFAAKLGFSITAETAEPIYRIGHLLEHVPSARLFDEVLKLLMSGHAQPTFDLLKKYKLFNYLFPNVDLEGSGEQMQSLIERTLINTDNRLQNDQRVTPAFLFAALLWPPLLAETKHLTDDASHFKLSLPILQQAANTVIDQQRERTAIPKRFATPMREIWELQVRLPRRRGKRAERLLEHPRFRAAYDFLLLREQAGEKLNGLGQWWADYQEANSEQRQQMVSQL